MTALLLKAQNTLTLSSKKSNGSVTPPSGTDAVVDEAVVDTSTVAASDANTFAVTTKATRTRKTTKKG